MSRIYRLIVWGRELFSWEVDGALEITVTTDAEDEDVEGQDITGGSSGLFERDMNPPNVNHEEPWYEEGRARFGFQGP